MCYFQNSRKPYIVKTSTGARAFRSCGPTLWNRLPLFVRSALSKASFKRRLKTHLFDLAFPPQLPAHPVVCWRFRTESWIFAFGHWFVWCATEPGLSRGYWRNRSTNLIDWYADIQVEQYLEHKKLWHTYQSGFRTSFAMDSCLISLSRVNKKKAEGLGPHATCPIWRSAVGLL